MEKLVFVKRNKVLKNPKKYENLSFYFKFSHSVDLYKGKIIKSGEIYLVIININGLEDCYDLKDIKEFYGIY